MSTFVWFVQLVGDLDNERQGVALQRPYWNITVENYQIAFNYQRILAFMAFNTSHLTNKAGSAELRNVLEEISNSNENTGAAKKVTRNSQERQG